MSKYWNKETKTWEDENECEYLAAERELKILKKNTIIKIDSK